MAFEEWWELHAPSYPDSNQARAFARWAWQTATAAERERCASRSLAAVNVILEDLTDRRGLRQAWQQIDLETQVDIINAWKDAIVTVMSKKEEVE